MQTQYNRSPRNRLPLGALLLVITAGFAMAAERVKIDLDYVAERAKELSARAYDDDWGHVPTFLRDLGYDAYQDIRFNPNRALWAEDKLPFRIEFFHPGRYYNRAVRIHEFSSTHEQEIPFSTDFFDYGHQTDIRRRVSSSLGYAGFRVRYPINKANQFDEVAVFVGSSYFRVTARGLGYGVSARCLAINTTTTNLPEEFPLFREFWLGKPEANADSLCLYALIDSPSVAGAYSFVLHPGEETSVHVRGRLFFRAVPLQIGLAPFSSMFLYGENTLQKPQDYRPEVHDSDGLLLIPSTNSYIWAPLDNPPISYPARVFPFEIPVRFALLQRDRNFEHYQDIDDAYQLRPSVLVEPGAWGRGRVMLYTFPSNKDTVDNVAAFWQPDLQPAKGVPYDVDYLLRYLSTEPSSLGIVVATRTGQVPNAPGFYECVVDFSSKTLATLHDVDPVKAVFDSIAGVTDMKTILQKNNFNGTWRLFIRFQPPAAPQEARFRVHLEMEGQLLSETWEYAWHELMM